MKYIIAWRSRITGFASWGVTKHSAEVAEQIVEQANKDFPDLRHWKEAAEPTSDEEQS